MRGLSLLRPILKQTLNRQIQDRRQDPSGTWPQRTPASQGRSGAPRVWLRLLVLAGFVGGVIGGASFSCVVPDTEYCSTREQCPMVETDFGMMQLLCHPTRHVCVNAGQNTCFSDMDCTDFRSPR